MCDPALLIEPKVRLRGEIRDAPLRKELRRYPLPGGFISDVLGALFAEFEMRTLAVGFWPGTSGTIDAILLIKLQQGARAADEAHLAPRKPGGDQRGFRASGDLTNAFDFGWLGFCGRLSVRR